MRIGLSQRLVVNMRCTAIEAARFKYFAMQVSDLVATGTFMQVVDVLRDHLRARESRTEAGNGRAR